MRKIILLFIILLLLIFLIPAVFSQKFLQTSSMESETLQNIAEEQENSELNKINKFEKTIY